MEKRQKRMEYKRNYRQVEKRRKRTNSFIAEYTRIKFPYVHNEAINFYSALNQLYPNKDATKTKEFKTWKEAIINPQEPEQGIIVNHLYTDVSYEEKATEKATESDNNSDTESDSDNNNNNSDTESASDNNNNSDTESDDNNSSDTEMNSNQKNFQDNMLLEIPLGIYSPSDNQNENNQSIVSDEPPNAPSNNEYDFEAFSDERLREIVNELRDDPELRNIFWEQENDSADEGVELKTLEEEVELDIEPFDYRLEVELADW